MKKSKKAGQSYFRNLETAIIISILMCVILFLLFPRFTAKNSGLQGYPLPRFQLIEIPRTIQEPVQRYPRPSVPSIPVASDEPDLMDDVFITTTDLSDSGMIPLLGPGEVSALPFIPRQILEVLPERSTEDIEGFIRLALLIGLNGKVLEYRVLENTTGHQDILLQVIEAVKKSRWEPVIIDNTRYEYWIEKSYRFNSSENL